MKKILVGLLALGSLSVFAGDVCTVKTQGESNPLLSCTAKSEAKNGTAEQEATQNTTSTLKILLDRGYKVESTTNLSGTNDTLFLLIKS